MFLTSRRMYLGVSSTAVLLVLLATTAIYSHFYSVHWVRHLSANLYSEIAFATPWCMTALTSTYYLNICISSSDYVV